MNEERMVYRLWVWRKGSGWLLHVGPSSGRVMEFYSKDAAQFTLNVDYPSGTLARIEHTKIVTTEVMVERFETRSAM